MTGGSEIPHFPNNIMTIASINVYTPSRGASTSLSRKWATKSEVAKLQEQIDKLEQEIERLGQENKTLRDAKTAWKWLYES